MATVRLRAEAASDLAAILEYSIEQFGREIAESYLHGIDHIFTLLTDHPMSEVFRDDIDPPIRCISHRRHRIFYDVEGDNIWIVRVLHHSMDERRWLG